MHKILKYVTYINVFQCLAWLGLALFILPAKGHFLYDEAYFYNEASEIARLFLIPHFSVSISGSSPLTFTPGGAFYFIISLPFHFFSHPQSGTVWLILLSVLGILFFDLSLRKINADKALRFFLIFFLVWGAWHAKLVDRIWNVNLYFFSSLFLISFTIRYIFEDQQKQFRNAFFWGIFASINLQIHFGGSIIVACCLTMILIKSFKSILSKNMLAVVSATILMYSPYLIYEFKNNFSNTKLLMNLSQHSRYFNSVNVEHAMISLLTFLAGFQYPQEVKTIFERSWSDLDKAAIFNLVTTFLVILFVLVRFSANRRKNSLFFFVPFVFSALFFYLTNRDFQPHYIASTVPLMLIFAGVSFFLLWEMSPFSKKIVVPLVILSLFSQTFVWVDLYQNYSRVMISDWVSLSEKVIEENEKSSDDSSEQNGIVVPWKRNKSDAFITWAVAKNHFNKKLKFQLYSDSICTVNLGSELSKEDILIDFNSYFSCVNPLQGEPAGEDSTRS